MFARLGSWCFRRRKRVVGMWLLALVVLGGASGATGSSFGDEFAPPGFESTRGIETLKDEFGGQGAGIVGTIVFRADQGVGDPAIRAEMEDFFQRVQGIDDRLVVTSPYEPGGELQISSKGAEAGRIAYADLEIPGSEDWQEAGEIGREIEDVFPQLDGLQVELGGQAFGEFETPDSEVIGLAFAIVILVLAFGSVLAMGLPIGVALAGIAVGTIITTILSNVISMPDFATFLGIMIGLGVGIDYALFIVTRFRENLHHGDSLEQATAVAIDTAGRAVTFAGATVVISFLGMLVMGVSFIQGLAVGCAAVVATTVVASLTLLPAFLGFAGERIETTRWRGLIAAGLVAVALVGVGLKFTPLMLALPVAVVVLALGFALAPLRREVPRRETKPLRQTRAYRWSRWIQHHPWPAALGGSVLLVVLALPVFGLRLGFSDEGNFAEDTTTRQAYDLLTDGFGDGFNGPFFLATRNEEGLDPAVLAAVTDAVAADEGIAFVSPPVPNDPADPTAALWRVIPTSKPQAEATTATVNRLRADVLTPYEDQLGTEVAVTGQVPATVDFSKLLSSRMPYFFGAVLALSFLLLMAVFRSLLVPLKAVVMNLLSIGASYGIVVAIFQWGWLGDVVGVAPGPIETFAPMMLFAIVFGLSMDYEVFLLSRVREEYHRTGDSHTSVANGLAATARVITAAAAIMVFVFGSFLLEADRTMKLFGIGLSVAVLLDATVVRMLLVPATMELLGDRNWWLPRWLDRLLPQINVEGTPDTYVDDGDDDLDDELERELQPV